MQFTELIVCPVCHGELYINNLRHKSFMVCADCQRNYKFIDGLLDATPIPPPDPQVLARWALWEKLQKNGMVAYTRAPELNLSIGQREDADAFFRFADLRGWVLDVGCGPQARPAYAQEFNGELVGIDPLRGVQPRRFNFIQGIGEFLPLRAHIFERVLFGTTLDHMLNPQLALREALRVLAPNGSIIIWYGDLELDTIPVPPVWWKRWLRRAQEKINQKDFQGLARLILARLGLGHTRSKYEYMNQLTVPEGAVDHFHFYHLTEQLMTTWLDELGLIIVDRHILPGTNNKFMCVRPQNHTTNRQ